MNAKSIVDKCLNRKMYIDNLSKNMANHQWQEFNAKTFNGVRGWQKDSKTLLISIPNNNTYRVTYTDPNNNIVRNKDFETYSAALSNCKTILKR